MLDNDWNDLFLRTDTSETSPNERKGGLGSPDIIPVGAELVNPSDYITEESYGKTYQKGFVVGSCNYIYVRTKNSSPQNSKNGKAYLVMADPALVIWPGGTGWTRLKTDKGEYGSPIFSPPSSAGVGPGKIGITTCPFDFIPSTKDEGHRCLVSWLSTEDHPLDDLPPRITTQHELADFLVHHPNYAHHNIDIAENTIGHVQYEKPYTHGEKPATMVFGLKTRHMQGFHVGFSCGVPLPDGKYIQLNDIVVTQDDITIIVERDVPAHFSGTIRYYYESSSSLPSGGYVGLVAYLKSPRGDSLYEFAKPFSYFGIRNNHLTDSDARGIQVGSIGVMKEA